MTIRIRYYQGYHDIEAFTTVDAAKQSIPVAHNQHSYRGYAVLFQYEGQYAVYVHPEDRYYSTYLPFGSNALFGGWWEKDKPVAKWEQIGNVSQGERDLLGDALADFFENKSDEHGE